MRQERKPDLAEPGVKSPPVPHGGDARWAGASCDKSEVTCAPDSAIGAWMLSTAEVSGPQ